MHKVYIVQNRDTGEFLKPDGIGSVETCTLVNQAGYFTDYQAALETALDEMDGQDILIFGFYLSEKEMQ
ncbi:hypothetical protein ACKLNO_01240 [Neisseriaceae bacterium B1]